ncbi:MAG: G5 domain-containing protein [Faecousia sp.]
MTEPKRSAKSTPIRSVRLTAALLAVLCPLILLAPTAFAKTYVITDGERTITYTTFATDPAQVLEGAGMDLREYDTYTTQDDDSITIRRALEVTLSYRGKSSLVSSTGETVGELLDRLGLDVTADDTLSHPRSAPVTDGMELTVDSIVTRRETYTATLPHETTYCADASLPKGTEEVLIEGQDGELLYTADVTYVNGTEIRREILSQRQSIAPVTEVIAQGSGDPIVEQVQEMPIIRDGYIIMPSGEILTYYKTDNVTATGYTHTDAGCDMITSTGTTVHYGTVAVDPRFIPYGTRMLIVSHDGERYYGIATAEDCGGAIKRDKMDLYFPTYQECIEFGRRRCTIYFLG